MNTNLSGSIRPTTKDQISINLFFLLLLILELSDVDADLLHDLVVELLPVADEEQDFQQDKEGSGQKGLVLEHIILTLHYKTLKLI